MLTLLGHCGALGEVYLRDQDTGEPPKQSCGAAVAASAVVGAFCSARVDGKGGSLRPVQPPRRAVPRFLALALLAIRYIARQPDWIEVFFRAEQRHHASSRTRES